MSGICIQDRHWRDANDDGIAARLICNPLLLCACHMLVQVQSQVGKKAHRWCCLIAGALQRSCWQPTYDTSPEGLGACCRSISHVPPLQVDVLYLHNAVETQLGALGETAFLERLHMAFTWLEEARKQGRIRAYGLATWDCFRKPPLVLSAAASGYMQLQRIVNLAKEVGGSEHGFRCAAQP